MRGETYRVEKNKNYSVISNFHLRDKRLSFAGCALLSRILSLPEDCNITQSRLISMCKEGYTAVRNALDELERYGYLDRHKLPRSSGGQFGGVEYVIYEVPKSIFADLNSGKISQKEALSKLYEQCEQEDDDGVVQSAVWPTDSGNQMSGNQTSDQPTAEIRCRATRRLASRQRESDVGQSDVWPSDVGQSDVWPTDCGFPNSANPNLEPINTRDINKYNPVMSSQKVSGVNSARGADGTGQDRQPPWFARFDYNLEAAYRWVREKVAESIDLEGYEELPALTSQTYAAEAELRRDAVRELYRLIVDTVCSTKPTVRIAGEEKPTDMVRDVFLSVNSDTIALALERLKTASQKIRSHRAYYLTALYDAATTGQLEVCNGLRDVVGEPQHTPTRADNRGGEAGYNSS